MDKIVLLILIGVLLPTRSFFDVSIAGVSLEGIKLSVLASVLYVLSLKHIRGICINNAEWYDDMKYYMYFVGMCLLSLMWSYSLSSSLRYIYYLPFSMMCYAAYVRMQHIGDLAKKVIRIATVMFLVSCVCLWIQKQGNVFTQMDDAPMKYISIPGDVFFISTKIVVLLAIYYFFIGYYMKKRSSYIIAVCLGLFIVMTWARAYIGGMVAGIIVPLYCVVSKRQRFFLICVLIVMGIVICNTDNPFKNKHFRDPKNISIGVLIKDPLKLIDRKVVNDHGRSILAQKYIKGLTSYNSWWLGGGINAVRPFLQKDVGSSAQGLYAHADHNKYLAELGIIGLMIYILMVIFYFNKGVVLLKKSCTPQAKLYSSVFLAGICYWIVGGIASEVFYPIGYFEFVLLFLALARREQSESVS